jgi:hypothetical protein
VVTIAAILLSDLLIGVLVGYCGRSFFYGEKQFQILSIRDK